MVQRQRVVVHEFSNQEVHDRQIVAGYELYASVNNCDNTFEVN